MILVPGMNWLNYNLVGLKKKITSHAQVWASELTASIVISTDPKSNCFNVAVLSGSYTHLLRPQVWTILIAY